MQILCIYIYVKYEFVLLKVIYMFSSGCLFLSHFSYQSTYFNVMIDYAKAPCMAIIWLNPFSTGI